MLQNASYIFLKEDTKQNKTKQNDYEKKKKSHPAGVEPETFGV